MSLSGYKNSVCCKWYVTLVMVSMALMVAGDNSQFFLKTSKSIPRMGRRGDPNAQEPVSPFFLKTSKSIPRLGRRGQPEWPLNQDSQEGQAPSEELVLTSMQDIPPAIRDRLLTLLSNTEDNNNNSNNGNNRGIWWMG